MDPSPEQSRFRRREMVRWYSPLLLLRTGVRAALSTGMGRIADTREALRLSTPDTTRSTGEPFDYSDRDGIWVDYVADIGDGWDSAFAVARGLAAPTQSHAGNALPRGEVLIFGGDAVYPDPTIEDYLDRTVLPYRTAYEEVEPFKADLFALPGNHDWYDGLRAFSDIFYVADREHAGDPDYSFGGWTPRQSRSYFALSLPGRWWLCTVDIQLDSRIDAAQYDYFKGIATDYMQSGDRVFLCIATPTWEDVSQKPNTNDKTLAAVTELFEMAGHSVDVLIGGNFHHYAHYHPEGEGPHMITAGGGGAFMHPTHKLPDAVDVHWRKGETQPYRLGAVSPSKAVSHRLSYGNLLFPFKNWEFAVVIGLVYMLMSWILETGRQTDESTVDEFFRRLVSGNLSLGDTMLNFVTTFPKSPIFAMILIGTLFALVLYNWCGHWLASTLFGVVHSSAHFLAMGVTFTTSAMLASLLGTPDWHPLIAYPSFMASMLVIGTLLGGLVFGVFMIVAHNVFGVLSNNAFSPLRIADHKNFVRLHFSSDGTLSVYPFKIDKVGKNATPPTAAEPGFTL